LSWGLLFIFCIVIKIASWGNAQSPKGGFQHYYMLN